MLLLLQESNACGTDMDSADMSLTFTSEDTDIVPICKVDVANTSSLIASERSMCGPHNVQATTAAFCAPMATSFTCYRPLHSPFPVHVPTEQEMGGQTLCAGPVFVPCVTQLEGSGIGNIDCNRPPVCCAQSDQMEVMMDLNTTSSEKVLTHVTQTYTDQTVVSVGGQTLYDGSMSMTCVTQLHIHDSGVGNKDCDRPSASCAQLAQTEVSTDINTMCAETALTHVAQTDFDETVVVPVDGQVLDDGSMSMTCCSLLECSELIRGDGNQPSVSFAPTAPPEILVIPACPTSECLLSHNAQSPSGENAGAQLINCPAGSVVTQLEGSGIGNKDCDRPSVSCAQSAQTEVVIDLNATSVTDIQDECSLSYHDLSSPRANHCTICSGAALSCQHSLDESLADAQSSIASGLTNLDSTVAGVNKKSVTIATPVFDPAVGVGNVTVSPNLTSLQSHDTSHEKVNNTVLSPEPMFRMLSAAATECSLNLSSQPLSGKSTKSSRKRRRSQAGRKQRMEHRREPMLESKLIKQLGQFRVRYLKSKSILLYISY